MIIFNNFTKIVKYSLDSKLEKISIILSLKKYLIKLIFLLKVDF